MTVEQVSNPDEMPIADLDISARPLNSLRRYGVKMVGELTRMEPWEVSDMRGMGATSFDELHFALLALGLDFKNTNYQARR